MWHHAVWRRRAVSVSARRRRCGAALRLKWLPHIGIVLDLSVGVDDRGGVVCRPCGGVVGSVPDPPLRLGAMLPAEAVLHAMGAGCARDAILLLAVAAGRSGCGSASGHQRRTDEEGSLADDDRHRDSCAGWLKSVLANGGQPVGENDDDVVERQKLDGARGHDSERCAERAPHSQVQACGGQGGDDGENEQSCCDGKACAS